MNLNGNRVLLRVGAQWGILPPRPGSWIFVSGEARTGHTENFSAAETVVINHNLGRVPGAVTVRVGGVEADVQVTHLSSNTLVLSFDVPRAGTVEIV